MPAITSLTLVENAVNHVFIPLSQNGNVAVLETNEMHVASAEKTLTLSFDKASSKRNTDKVKILLTYPQELGDAVDGYLVKDTAIGKVELTIPSAFSSVNRDAFALLVQDLVADAIFTAYAKRDPYY
jgi:hypothetical protein